MSTRNTAIFDLDGTLLNTIHAKKSEKKLAMEFMY